ncbi:MAG: FAD binding domain-containing protein [Thermoanaerobaculia bacterium]|nr:FAD binding domain-containing protein [Thermoanaerobaculia bacterium]
MLRLPPFTLRQPSSLDEALDILSSEESCRIVAGGTDLWPNMKRRHQKAETVVSLLGIDGLRGIRTNGEVRIGATTTLREVETHPTVRDRYPGLATAVASISSPPLRNMGTLGGNVCVDTRCTYYNQTEDWRRSIDYCMKEEGEICWVAPSSSRCWAHSASDSAPMLWALGGRIVLVGPEGERTIPVEALYRDDGIDYLTKRPEEIVTEILVPQEASTDRCRSAFWKLRRRGSIDFAVLSAAVALWLDGDTISRASIVLGAVGSSPRPCEKAEELLVGEEPTEEVLAEAAQIARRSAIPMDNTDFQAQWRKAVAGKYVEGALREAAGLETDRLAPKHPRPTLAAGR